MHGRVYDEIHNPVGQLYTKLLIQNIAKKLVYSISTFDDNPWMSFESHHCRHFWAGYQIKSFNEQHEIMNFEASQLLVWIVSLS